MKPIWTREFTLEDLHRLESGTFATYIGVEFTEIGPDYLAGRMRVQPHMRQPWGVLHGGASVALAETLGSVGANFAVDSSRFRCVGQMINANHLRPVSSGFVHGLARRFGADERSQVWGIDIRNEAGRMVCVSRLTMAVIARA